MKTGRTYLSMAESYREKGKKYPRTATIESFGYVDELQKIYDDPIAHFTAYVEEQNEKRKTESAEHIIKERKDTTLDENTSNRRNFGYVALLKIYYELGLDRFLINRQRNRNFAYNTSTILKLLVISRILKPASKKRTYENRKDYFEFEREDLFSLIDVYRALSFFAEHSLVPPCNHKSINKSQGSTAALQI